ncbi:MAG: hypothetical protein DRJ05_05930 [Bacteroidetes bacterium]|nr:MAG: hypothetical protein DRJ05_05930 [Bacteroidota bacterium]
MVSSIYFFYHKRHKRTYKFFCFLPTAYCQLIFLLFSYMAFMVVFIANCFLYLVFQPSRPLKHWLSSI